MALLRKALQMLNLHLSGKTSGCHRSGASELSFIGISGEGTLRPDLPEDT